MRKVLLSLAIIVGPISPVWAEPVTLAALGDSLTQGFGLPAEQGFVPQLEATLRDQGLDVVIVNAGVSGDTSQGGAARVGWTLTPDVDGLIVALGANDFLRGIDPAVTRANLDQILDEAGRAGVDTLLIGFKAPGNFGPDYKQAFDAIYAELGAAHDVQVADDFFAGFARMEEDPAQLRRLMQADGLHPNAAGVALIVQALVPDVEALARRAGAR